MTVDVVAGVLLVGFHCDLLLLVGDHSITQIKYDKTDFKTGLSWIKLSSFFLQKFDGCDMMIQIPRRR